MIAAILAVAAAAASVSPDTRTFWRPVEGQPPQPGQVQIAATKMAEGNHVVVYQADGYSFSSLGQDDEHAQIETLVQTFDETIFPRETALFGEPPDLDGNGKVIVLICGLEQSSGAFFWFDEMSEPDANRYGFHSNQGEILYHRFEQQGNRRTWNLRAVAATFHQLLHYADDQGETTLDRVIAAYSPYLCGLASARWLWGDVNPAGQLHRPSEPFAPGGWSPLFIEYLRDQFGTGFLQDLVRDSRHGFPSLDAVLAQRGFTRSGADALADMAMACWVDDPAISDGRFSFADVAPRRPVPAVRVSAARPGAGYVQVGAGGMTHVVLDGSDRLPLPLTLQGDPDAAWIGRAVLMHNNGPDTELPLKFDPNGTATLQLPTLADGDSAVVAVVPVPETEGLFDDRLLTLQWGLGWVPKRPERPGAEPYVPMLKDALPDAGMAAAARLQGTILELTGKAEGDREPAVTTRYAWAPESDEVVKRLEAAAKLRGLQPSLERFSQPGPAGLSQSWTNVLIELPGSDPRRWPVVIAAHWDGMRGSLADCYLRALNADDNASGVAVALELASSLARTKHRSPILVALLDGGYEDAAGAKALLDRLQGHVAIWIELDGVAIPSSEGDGMAVYLEGGQRFGQLPATLSDGLREIGLRPVRNDDIRSPHSGAIAAAARGIASVVVRTRTANEAANTVSMPLEVESRRLVPELSVLITKSLADSVVRLAGTD